MKDNLFESDYNSIKDRIDRIQIDFFCNNNQY